MPRHIDRFEQFSKHIPKLLRRQLIVSSLRQLKQIDGIDSIEHKRALSIDTTTASDDPYILTCAPSLERFHAVLLFIDISGFTMLSQKLHVDQLHKEINAYFKQLIDIIELCQGEVIKFAGDAMFVVWQTPVCSLEDGSFVHACQQQVEQAIYCAKRINLSCSDYKIDFLHPQDGHVEHICLNVHSGLSVGLMAGIDIGAMDRWEYFIIGKPLQEAAEAESHATNGQLLISQVAHDILHPANTPCTCQVMSNCCYLVTDLCTKSTAFMQEVWSAKKNAIVNEYEEYLEYDCRLYNDILADISQAERAVLQCGILKRKKLDFVMNGIQGSLLDNIVRHCHEVVRVAYTFVEDWIKDSPTSQFAPTPGSQLRDGFFEGDEDISYPSLSSSTSLQSTATDSKTIASKRPNSTHTKHSFVSKLRKVATNRMQTLKEKYQARNERGMFTDSSLLADQREAIVMFINIALPKIELFQSNTASSLNNQANVTTKKVIEVASFHFLQRTEDELKADQQLVDRLQQCYDAIMLAVHTFHGQLRQFIVDDKGTVCIVSFGMRGSMKNHTASDAVEASKMIVTSLNAIQVQASIGLTSGKVYGGLVGSPKRHEYAVMGPSVNLAARLMGKCILNDTLCDHEVSARDSMHHFFSKGTIIAKGYSAAVPTYSPIFATMFTNLEVQFHHLQHLQNVTELVRYHSKTMSTQHAGTLERSATGLSNTSPAVTKRKPPLHHSAHSAHKKIPPRRKLPHHQLRPDSFRNFIAYGREAESQQVYEVFLKYAKDMGDNIELVKAELLQAATINSIIISPGSQSRDVHRSKHQFARECFDNQQPPSTILILGSTGIGKTHFCQSIFSHLNHLLDNSTFSNWNLLMVSNLGLMKSAEVFHDWRYIIVELLAKLTDTQALISHEQADLVSSLNSFMKPHEKANVALQYLMKKLSWQSQEGFKYFLEFFPVFQEIDCSPYRHQQHATFDKSSIEKIGIVMKLLIELLGLIVEESKCLICIWIDEYNQMETHSMALLRQLQASSNKGFLFLLSKSSGSSSLKANKSKAIQQDDAMLAMHTIELNPLALADVAHIANEIFDVQLASIAGIANRQLPFGIVEKIFVASSGIPLYVTEITKAFSKTYDTLTEHFLATYSSIQEPEEGEEGEEGRLAQTQLTEEMSQSVLSILQHLNIGRIEEAICFRVDQLSVPCQMLLKIIATANANESAASLDMLVSIIMATAGFGLEAFTAILEEAEEEYDAPQHPQSPNDAENHHNQRIKDKLMETIMNFVDEVLQMDDFLEEVQSTAGFVLEAKATDDDNSIDCNRFRYFRFHVELERLTIYKMMLEEQRSFLHDKIATYLEEERKACMESSKQDPTKLLSVELWAEEGFHWAAGHVWSAALQCFDESATLHCQQHPTDYEQSIIFFQQAVSMWISLQQEYAINSAVASLISASSPAKMDNSTRTPTASATSLPPSASAVTIFQPYSNQYAAAAFLTSPRISAVTKSTTSSTSSTTTSTSSSVDSSTSSRDASIQSVEGLNSTFTRQILFQIFAGDIELFDQTLRMLVKFLITCIQYQRSLHPPHHVSSILSNEDDIFIWINHILKEIATMIKGMFVNESLMLKTTTATVTTMLNKSSSSSKLSSKTNKSIKSRRSSRHHSFMQAAIEDFSIQQISSCIPVLQEIIRLFEVQDLSVSCEIPSAVFQELLQQVLGSE